MKKEIVRFENVSAGYDGIDILENISFKLKDNTFLGIIGPNGGGKTTLLKVLLGLLKPRKGKVTVFGKSPTEASNKIGYVPQGQSFDREFPISVFDVTLMGRLNGNRLFFKYSDEDKKAALDALKLVKMEKFKDRQISQLSGGELQRVLVARALTVSPKLLVLDEPTSSIDPDMQSFFYELMDQLKKEMSIVLVTHEVGAVSLHVDEIACLNRKLHHHGDVEHGLKSLEKTYGCPIRLVTHHRPHEKRGKKIC